MLILSRKVGEALKIGADVTVKVLCRTGNQVKLGIAALAVLLKCIAPLLRNSGSSAKGPAAPKWGATKVAL